MFEACLGNIKSTLNKEVESDVANMETVSIEESPQIHEVMTCQKTIKPFCCDSTSSKVGLRWIENYEG